MTKKTLAAAMRAAYYVAEVDDLEKDEAKILLKELKSFGLSEEDETDVIKTYQEMDCFEAVNILRVASQDDKKEASALIFATISADGEISEREMGATILMIRLCQLEVVSPEEGRKILGFGV